MIQNQEKVEFSTKLVIVLTIYLASLFASNTIGSKLMPFIFGTQLSVAVFYFPFVFITTDIVGEVYGKKTARLFVMAGALSIALFLLYSAISGIAPWGPRALWMKSSYNQIFGLSARISIASLLAYIIGEYQDVLAFFFFKQKTNLGSKFVCRFLWSVSIKNFSYDYFTLVVVQGCDGFSIYPIELCWHSLVT